MLNLPPPIMSVLMPFAPLFQAKTWHNVSVLLVGAILAPGKRTVTAALRVMGLGGEAHYARYHQVLNRAVWSPLAVAQGLLILLIKAFCPEDEPLVFGMDDTIERRWGAKIAARGIYRDPVRSSESHLVKASGLRWISLMLLARMPWAERVWALPFMTVLAPSERYYETRGRTPKTLTERAVQMVKQLRRWLPNRTLVIVGDRAYAALDLLAACQALSEPVTVVTRLRTDAALYEPAPPYAGWAARAKTARGCQPRRLIWMTRRPSGLPSRHGGTMDKSARWNWLGGQPCGFITAKHRCQSVGSWSVTRRVRMKRCVCCVRTQAWHRTRLLNGSSGIGKSKSPLKKPGGISVLKRSANGRIKPLPVPRRCCWACFRGLPWWLMRFTPLVILSPYANRPGIPPLPTFSDALALVRYQLWFSLPTFHTSGENPDTIKVSRPLFVSLVETLCYAA